MGNRRYCSRQVRRSILQPQDRKRQRNNTVYERRRSKKIRRAHRADGSEPAYRKELLQCRTACRVRPQQGPHRNDKVTGSTDKHQRKLEHHKVHGIQRSRKSDQILTDHNHRQGGSRQQHNHYMERLVAAHHRILCRTHADGNTDGRQCFLLSGTVGI